MAKTYPDEVKAQVLLSLKVNDNNQKKTSRDTGVPLTTIRRWRKDWDDNGIPDHLWELGKEEATGFVEQAKHLRTLAMAELENQLKAGEVKPAQLIATVGVLTDKINLAEGFATSRQETVTQVALPSPEATADFVQKSLALMREREDAIEGTAREITDKALPPTKE